VAVSAALLQLSSVRRRARGRRGGIVRAAAAPAVQEASKEAQSDARRVLELTHGGQKCVLVQWYTNKHIAAADEWLEGWKGGGGQGEAKFWRNRTIMTVQQKLQMMAGTLYDEEARTKGRFDGTDRGPKKEAPTFQIYALHAEGELSQPPLALALTTERPFPVGGLKALHIDQLLSNPGASKELSGSGAALVRSLLDFAAGTGSVLTVEPQSAELEAYFGRLRFQKAPLLDPYLWFHGGSSLEGAPLVEVRYALPSADDYERILAAFKRPPLWIEKSEEAFMSPRNDSAGLDTFVLRIARMEAVGMAKATVKLFERGRVGGSYVEVGEAITLDVVDAMGVMRNPDALDKVRGDLRGSAELAEVAEAQERAKSLDKGAFARRPVSFVVNGRCTVQQRSYPMPGMASEGVELILDSLDLPMSVDPICSASLRVPLPLLAEASDAIQRFFSTFKVRAGMHHSSAVWNLEMVQTNGIAAAQMEASLPEEAEDFGDSDLADADLFRDPPGFRDSEDSEEEEEDDSARLPDLRRGRGR